MSIISIQQTAKKDQGIFSCAHTQKIRVKCFGYSFIKLDANFAKITPLGKVFKMTAFGLGFIGGFALTPIVAGPFAAVAVGACSGFSSLKIGERADSYRIDRNLSRNIDQVIEVTVFGFNSSKLLKNFNLGRAVNFDR